MDLISVIVPVYNAEKTIGGCIGSILSQDYRNIEVIVVDDGSTDGSGAIIDSYAESDGRVRAVHTQNRGVSAARNTGISLARGKFFGFVDADDRVEKDMFARLIGLIENADISVCGLNRIPEVANGPANPPPVHSGVRMLNPFEACREALKNDNFGGYLFNKLFRSYLFKEKGIRLNEKIHICEDLLCFLECLRYARRIVFDPAIRCRYFISPGSATASGFSPRKATLVDARRAIADFTRSNFSALYRTARNQYITAAVYIFVSSLHSSVKYDLKRSDLNRIRKGLLFYLFSRAPRFYKPFALALCVSPRFAKALWKLAHLNG